MLSSGTNNKYKTVMCKHFEQTGHCYLEARCHFAHGKEELRKLNDPLPEGQGQGGDEHKSYQSFSSYGGPSQVSNYKTMKCKFFEKGHCKYEQNCSYAHGDEEMRAPSASNMQNMMPNMQMGNTMGYYDPSVQNQLVQQQVQYLIEQLEKVHAQDPDLSAQIHEAKETNKSGNYQTAGSIVYGIINRPNKNAEEAQQYNTIMQNIQAMGAGYYQQVQMQYQQNPYGYQQQYAPQMMGMMPGMNMGYPYGGMGQGMYGGNNYQNRPYKQNYKQGGGYGGGRRYNNNRGGEEHQGNGETGEENGHEGGDVAGVTNMMDNMQIAQQQTSGPSSNFRGGRGGHRYGGNTRGGRRFNQNQ